MKTNKIAVIEPLPSYNELEDVKGMMLDVMDEESLACELSGEHRTDDHIEQDESGFQDFITRRMH